jgi:hypothetical protein
MLLAHDLVEGLGAHAFGEWGGGFQGCAKLLLGLGVSLAAARKPQQGSGSPLQVLLPTVVRAFRFYPLRGSRMAGASGYMIQRLRFQSRSTWIRVLRLPFHTTLSPWIINADRISSPMAIEASSFPSKAP